VISAQQLLALALSDIIYKVYGPLAGVFWEGSFLVCGLAWCGSVGVWRGWGPAFGCAMSRGGAGQHEDGKTDDNACGYGDEKDRLSLVDGKESHDVSVLSPFWIGARSLWGQA